MANTDPRTIKQLCIEFGIKLEELLISCIFCRKNCTEFQIWSYMTKELFVIWKKGFPHIACPKCIEVQALVDWLRHSEKVANARVVEDETGAPLGDLLIRCLGCFKTLSPSEKIFQVEDKKPFTKIKGSWRGFCLNCITYPPPLTAYFLSVSIPRPRTLPQVYMGFDQPPRRLSESSSSGSSWTTTTTTPTRSSSSSISSGRRRDTLSDAESDGGEVLI
uniref:Protein E6 n=1 Tax=Phocoena spinipinnis papillomavirus TaxID=82676 RepID=A0A2L1DGF1_PSPV|nr:E6 protein [Omikronpapillomavirus 1]